MRDNDYFDGINEDDFHTFAAVGQIVQIWQYAEQLLVYSAMEMMGLDFNRETLIGRHISSVTAKAIIGDLANVGGRDATLIDVIGHTLQYFENCRRNRNLIVHSHREADRLYLPPDRHRPWERTIPASKEDILRVRAEVFECSEQIMRMLEVYRATSATTGYCDLEKMQAQFVKSPLPKLLAETEYAP